MLRWTRFVDDTTTPVAAAADQDLKTDSCARVVRDPYYRWAEATNWRGLARFAGPPNPKTLRIIAYFDGTLDQLHAALTDPGWKVPDFYKSAVPGSRGCLARHFTAEVDFGNREWLEGNPHGVRWELAVPFRDAESAARADRMGDFGPERELVDFRPREALPGEPVAPASVMRRWLRSAIAVVDFGCPFLNSRFDEGDRSNRTTRVAALWDQGSAAPAAGSDFAALWTEAQRAGYGRELAQASMDAVLACVRDASAHQAIDESEAYRRIDYLVAYDDPRRRVWGATHGGHVLDVAGGCPDPLTNVADNASKAPLVFVQLPALTASDGSGGSLSAQLLDAVRYILDVCHEAAPVVVNISYGTFAGPHDGSSSIERALDELLEARSKDFAIVVGAGNGRKAQCHLQRSVAKNRSALLRLDVAEGDTTDTFLEIWYARPEGAAVPLEVRARTADRDWSPWVPDGGHCYLRQTDAEAPVVAMLRHDAVVPNGAKALVLLALAPTRQPTDDPGPLSPAGRWEVEVRLAGSIELPDDAAILIDAWIERDDPGDSGTGAQSTFFGTRLDDADETLSSIATGHHTVVAGGFRLSDSMPAPYSSTSRHRALPQIYGACEEDAERSGVLASAVRSNEAHRMNGTSVAAPVVARRVYNWLTEVDETGARKRSVRFDEWTAELQRIVAAEGPRGDVAEVCPVRALRLAYVDATPPPAQRAESQRLTR